MAEISAYSAPPFSSPGMFSSGHPSGYSQARALLTDPRNVQLRLEEMERLFGPENVYELARRRQAAREQSGVVSGLTQFGAPEYDPQTAQELTRLAQARFSAARQFDVDEFNRRQQLANLYVRGEEARARLIEGDKSRAFRERLAALQRAENALNRKERAKQENLRRRWEYFRHTGRHYPSGGSRSARPGGAVTYTSARHGRHKNMEAYLRAINAMR